MTLPTLKQMEHNILVTYRSATNDEVLWGAQWYTKARQDCRRIARETGCTWRQVAGVIAALSPLNKWDRNLRDAERLCMVNSAEVSVSTTHRNKEKALSILNGISPSIVLKGQKTKAFWRNICGDDTYITVDSHAYNIALGRRRTISATTFHPRDYPTVSLAYRMAAQKADVTGPVMQATCWIVYRNEQMYFPIGGESW